MSEGQYVRTEVEEHVAVLTVDNPPVNSFKTEVVVELNEALDDLLGDDDVKAIVVTGGGTTAFVAGADIQEIREKLDQPGALGEAGGTGRALFQKVATAAKPFIAAINGFCLGGGLELAMACHLRVCSDRARLGQPEVNLGLIPGWGGTQRLPRLVGKGKALEMILTGDMITAQEAYRIGLVNKVVPAGAVLKEARGLARKISLKPRLPVAAAMRAVEKGLQVSLAEGLAVEGAEFGSLEKSEDAREGVSAFLEKRQAQFRDQ